jgi:hypothetical protein
MRALVQSLSLYKLPKFIQLVPVNNKPNLYKRTYEHDDITVIRLFQIYFKLALFSSNR